MSIVSIIIPVYNVEYYLPGCLDSVINQTYENIEIICVDDGSTDNSSRVLSQYVKMDNRIKVITQSNSGLSSSRNVGVDNSSGDYIMFVDSDDRISTCAVEHLLRQAVKTNSDVVIFDYVSKNEQTSKYNISTSRDVLGENVGQAFNVATLAPYKYNKIPVMTTVKMYRGGLLREGIRHKVGIIFEDVLFWSDVFLNSSRITYLPEVLYCYTSKRNGSIMNTIDRRVFDCIDIYKSIIDNFKKSGYWERYCNNIMLGMMMDLGLRYSTSSEEIQDEFYTRILDLNLDIDYEIYNSSDYSDMEKAYVRYFKLLNNGDYSTFKKCKLEVI